MLIFPWLPDKLFEFPEAFSNYYIDMTAFGAFFAFGD